MSSNQQRAEFEKSVRSMWTGSAMIVVGAALFVSVLLAMPYYFLLVAAALIGVGIGMVRVEMRRQRGMHPY